MKRSIIFIVILILSTMSCKNKKFSFNEKIDIGFLVELFNSDRINKDKTLLDNKFEIGNVDNIDTPQGEMRYEGYLKEGRNEASDKFEFIHYSEEGKYWLEYMTTNSKTTSSILGSIQANPSIKKISEGVFQDDKNTIVVERKTITGFSVYSVKIYENSFYKSLN